MDSPLLVVKKGEPYKVNELINILKPEVLIGRISGDTLPDISFSNSAISRRHLLLKRKNDQFAIQDLDSKHGTRLNNLKLSPFQDYRIQHDDIITLCEGVVVFKLVFPRHTNINGEETTDALAPKEIPIIYFNNDRREFLINGKTLSLSGKDFDLLLLFYNNQSRAVSNDLIRITIWPERLDSEGTASDVGNNEINTLVYRLRRKLEPYGHLIVGLPRFGYMLDLDNKI
ncbi:MAG: FHA domain-containing protein [Firmicutes bacterium]|nr:FHA domain-containing protein [Bacillota bacterium]